MGICAFLVFIEGSPKGPLLRGERPLRAVGPNAGLGGGGFKPEEKGRAPADPRPVSVVRRQRIAVGLRTDGPETERIAPMLRGPIGPTSRVTAGLLEARGRN